MPQKAEMTFTTQRQKGYSKANMTNNDQASSLGKRTSVEESGPGKPRGALPDYCVLRHADKELEDVAHN
jgi:hypothetical protein